MLATDVGYLLSSFFPIPFIASCLIMIIIYDYSTEKTEKVWMASKIKTVKDIITKKKDI